MKSLKYAVLAGCLLLAGCVDEFLDRKPISNMNEKDFFQTEADFENASIAMYNTLYTIYASDSPMAFVGQLMSDQCYTTNTAGNVAELLDIQNVDVKVANGIIKGWWEDYYSCIFRVNKFLSTLENSADIGNKAVYEGEAKFLRALYYFNMVRTWGAVPLVTKPLGIGESYEIGRTPVDQIYAQILEDLKAAVKLPAKARKKGVATQGAAYTLLGEVYLTLGDKTKAAEALRQVYGKYTLVDYASLWDLNNKNCAESIFEVQYKGGSGNPYSRYWSHYAPVDNFGDITVWGTGYNQVTDDLWNDYEPGDPRRDISIFYNYVGEKTGKVYDVKFPAKWVDKDAEISGMTEYCDNNFIVYRYANVLVMLSEATGDPQYLNEVRDRAGMPLWGSAEYPTDKYPTLDRAIEHERNVELALEFHRFFDLKRTGRAVDVLNACRHKNLTVDPRKLVLPIPHDVVVQNPLLVQDEVYK